MKENEASSTALTVMQGILYSSKKADIGKLVSQEQADVCHRILASVPEGQKRLNQLENPIYKALLPWMERLLIPGISRHYVLRKRFIENAARKLIDEGTQQVIILGAGFDTLAWRLAGERSDLTFIEIDHPATSRVKTKALECELSQRGNIHFHPSDLSQESLIDVLDAHPHYRRDLRTVFICEGVLMYLPQQAVEDLLQALRQLSQHPIHLIFTALEPMDSINNNTGWLLKKYLSFKGEKLSWEIPMEAMAPFLSDNGYRITDSAEGLTLRERYLGKDSTLAVHRGEYLILGEADAI